ncbi:hypothetical protein [Pseudomonas aeruginosa]|uniref:hypothetical protein n=1 Tax=Pseudomonas aeruginosa TaxID=287 RepID=UPI001F1F705E|nr:hypothetical protein [Pseudomonas aeruginosa]UGX01619.1 hypothetical protein LSG45_03045 [Pseudomonas aeruginosa]
MSYNIGEQQIVDAFSGFLKDKFRDIFGHEASYSIGNFAGKQDEVFSDFFAGTSSKNILIEFKEKESGLTSEKRKILRKALCSQIDDGFAQISRECHFAGWNSGVGKIQIELTSYIDKVCPLFDLPKSQLELFQAREIFPHRHFISAFLDEGLGVSPDEFREYIHFLDWLRDSGAPPGVTEFKAILYSYDAEGELIGTSFKSLDEALAVSSVPDIGITSKNSPRGPGSF